MTNVAEISGVAKSFGGLSVLRDVSFTVGRGELVGLIGPNGAGKTTLFNLIAGLLPPDSGTINLFGEDATALRADARARAGLARTFQHPRPFGEISVVENVMVGAFQVVRDARQAEARALFWLEKVGLGDRRSKTVKELTLLERKFLEIARALASDPSLLLLDEVLAGLNPTELHVAMELVRELRAGVSDAPFNVQRKLEAVLLIEHVMTAVMNLSDRVIVLAEGQIIAAGNPEDVVRDPGVLRAYLGDEFVLESNG